MFRGTARASSLGVTIFCGIEPRGATGGLPASARQSASPKTRANSGGPGTGATAVSAVASGGIAPSQDAPLAAQCHSASPMTRQPDEKRMYATVRR